MVWHAHSLFFAVHIHEIQMVWIHFVMRQDQNDLNNFQCHIVCTVLAKCPCYNAFLCINLRGVQQFVYCSCNTCPILRDEGAAVPAWRPCKISPKYLRKHVVQLAFKSNLFHESSLQVLLLVISNAQSTLCTHLRRAQTPFTHHN